VASRKFCGERYWPEGGGVELACQRDQCAGQSHEILAGGFGGKLTIAEIAAGYVHAGRRNEGSEPSQHLPQLGIDGEIVVR